jgi:hypothetical protein
LFFSHFFLRSFQECSCRILCVRSYNRGNFSPRERLTRCDLLIQHSSALLREKIEFLFFSPRERLVTCKVLLAGALETQHCFVPALFPMLLALRVATIFFSLSLYLLAHNFRKCWKMRGDGWSRFLAPQNDKRSAKCR